MKTGGRQVLGEAVTMILRGKQWLAKSKCLNDWDPLRLSVGSSDLDLILTATGNQWRSTGNWITARMSCFNVHSLEKSNGKCAQCSSSSKDENEEVGGWREWWMYLEELHKHEKINLCESKQTLTAHTLHPLFSHFLSHSLSPIQTDALSDIPSHSVTVFVSLQHSQRSKHEHHTHPLLSVCCHSWMLFNQPVQLINSLTHHNTIDS